MKSFKRTYLLMLSTLFFMTGIVGSRPLIPLLSNEFGANTFEIGLIISFFSLLPLFLAIKLGKWVDKIGALPFLMVSTILGGAALIFPFLFKDLYGVYLSQIIGGVAQTAFVLAAQSFVGEYSNRNSREKNISILSIGIAGGGFVGPLVGGILSDIFGFIETLALLGGVTYLALLILLYIYFKDEPSHTYTPRAVVESKESSISLLKERNLRKVMLIGMFILLTKDLYLYFFPLLGQQFGYSTAVIGVIIGVHNGAGILVRWFLISIIEKWGKSEVIVFSIVCSGALFGLLPFTEMLLLNLVISIFLGALLGIGQPLSITSAINFSPKDRKGETLGLRLTFNRFTQFTSPIIFGGVANAFNLNIVFWIVAVILMLGGANSFVKDESKASEKE